MKTSTELTAFLEKELDYDGSGEDRCPHCDKVIREGIYWIDHKSSLSSNVTQFIGFKMGSWDDSGINGLVYRAIEDFTPVSGKAKNDARLLAISIFNQIGLEPL